MQPSGPIGSGFGMQDSGFREEITDYDPFCESPS